MDYINFDRNQLVNLEYALKKEILRTNRAGGYSCSTILFCNTRKYHGLLVVPQPKIDNENHVLLSTFDVTVIQNEAEFNLGIHRYPNNIYHPKGHKYIRDLSAKTIPKLLYRVGGVQLTKETVFSSECELILFKLTLVQAKSPTMLRFRPFLAFRNVHRLSKANLWVEKTYKKAKNGAQFRMYQGYSPIIFQFSKKPDYVHVPDWHYNIEYIEELERGYDGHEDLFVPGYFEVPIEKGESIYVSASTQSIDPELLEKIFKSEVRKRIPRTSFENCLFNSAQQFIVRQGDKTEVAAGYPWFGRWGRDTFISLPGLTLTLGDTTTCKAVIDTMLSELNGPLFPNIGSGDKTAYNSVDSPLWFFWALQKYASTTNTLKHIWKEYGDKMKLILNGYRQGTDFNIRMLDNGLIYAGEPGKALTWMDAVVDGKPVTPRIGMPVEINALWYNAIMFSLEVAKIAKDKEFIAEWEPLAAMIPASFKATFWHKEKGYLADYVDGDFRDWSVRPNQVIATSLPYNPVSEKIRQLILLKCGNELLTIRGLRTLSPNHPDYKGIYKGDQKERDRAYHQGTVWPWLLGHYVEGYLKLYGESGLAFVKSLYHGFEETLREHGIGSISEIYDGDPPHKPNGTISQAWSVAEVLRIFCMIRQYEKQPPVLKLKGLKVC